MNFKYFKKEELGQLQRVAVFLNKDDNLLLCSYYDITSLEEDLDIYSMEEISLSLFQDIACKHNLLNKIELEDY